MFDLAAYLTRLALAPSPAADAAALAAVQRAHRLAIPFENLDVLLGRPIRIDTASVFAKLVDSRRGGYCFEHNRLFGDALAALGFAVRPLLARVWLGADDVPPRVHALSLVIIDGQHWIADAGFGGSYAPVMPLAEGAEADAADGARFRLAQDPAYGWMLWRRGDAITTDGRPSDPDADGWRRQYSFTLDPVFPADLELGNWWTSAKADTRLVDHAIVSLVLPRGFACLTDRFYRRRNADSVAEAEIVDPRQFRMRLSLVFGIDLSAEEVAGLGLFGRE